MSSQPFFIPAILILVAALPLILALIPPNRVYGIRTTETLSDQQLRYQVNRYGGLGIVGIQPVLFGSGSGLPE